MDDSNDTKQIQLRIIDYLDIIDQKVAVLHAALLSYSVSPDPALLEGVMNDALALRSVAHEAWQRAMIERAQSDTGALAGLGRSGANDVAGLLVTAGSGETVH